MGPTKAWERWRLPGISPAELVALVVLLLGSLTLTAVVWWTRAPTPLPAGSSRGGLGTGPSSAGLVIEAPTASEAPLVVEVAGLVARPGVIRLPAGSRVVDAIEAAGGVRDGAVTDGLNLARPLVDGEQVLVGTEGQPPAGAPAGPPSATRADGRLDLNLATAEELQELPGVGPVTAERILGHRDALGGFTDVLQLLEVPGIGPTRFAALEPLVAV